MIPLLACNPETLSAAEWGFAESYLSDLGELFLFLERPSRFPTLLAAWDNAQSVQGELQDERRSLL